MYDRFRGGTLGSMDVNTASDFGKGGGWDRTCGAIAGPIFATSLESWLALRCSRPSRG